MSYAERLKAHLREKRMGEALPKLTKAPFVSFGSDQGRHISSISSICEPRARVEIDHLAGRFHEVAGYLEFDCCMPRRSAEARAVEIIVEELVVGGLTEDEAMSALADTGDRQLIVRLGPSPSATTPALRARRQAQ